MLFPLIVGLMLHAAEPNEAEQAFRKMEMKLTSAKSLESTLDVKFESGSKTEGSIKGSMMLGEGNKARLEMAVSLFGQENKTTVISDGAKMLMMPDKGEKKTQDTPKQFNETLKAAIARTGFGVGFFLFGGPEQQKEFKIDDEMKVADFKLGKKEKIGDVEAQIIDYTLVAKNYKKETTMMVSVWVDTKTNLPLKRVVTMMNDKEKTTISETYSPMKIDEKIDPKKFELPKE